MAAWGWGVPRCPCRASPHHQAGGHRSATLLRKPRQFRTKEASGTRHSTAAPQRPKTLHPRKIQPILQKDIKNRITGREKSERTENCRGENVKKGGHFPALMEVRLVWKGTLRPTCWGQGDPHPPETQTERKMAGVGQKLCPPSTVLAQPAMSCGSGLSLPESLVPSVLGGCAPATASAV